jgi:hypothetical protein
MARSNIRFPKINLERDNFKIWWCLGGYISRARWKRYINLTSRILSWDSLSWRLKLLKALNKWKNFRTYWIGRYSESNWKKECKKIN